MRALPTETIVLRGEPVTINASDFDPSKHTRWDDRHRQDVTHVEEATRAAPTRASDGTDLGGLTKPQIRDWAAQRGLAVTVDIGAAKADLIAAVLAADAAPKAS
ncbi:MAG: hypothetical protein HQL38_19635 [Alphaproteobacteria bacterium]|nr:hypothetical protein [Alphaproteobacteria bacterium]